MRFLFLFLHRMGMCGKHDAKQENADEETVCI